MIKLSDDEARSLALFLWELPEDGGGGSEADEWAETLWDRRIVGNPSGPVVGDV